MTKKFKKKVSKIAPNEYRRNIVLKEGMLLELLFVLQKFPSKIKDIASA